MTTDALCAVQAARREDSMLGTAPPQTRVLLVHQPGAWGPRGLVESRCDPGVAARIDAAAAKAGMRLQAIRRPGKHEPGKPAGGYHVAIADTAPGVRSVTWWIVDDLAEIADELERETPRLRPAAVETAPLYLVCAHGRHDPCCALRGHPVAKALEAVRPGRVWETTHLGGDRFAANLLVLPSGHLYGRVPAALAPDLILRSDAGHVVPRLLRGRIGLPPIAQAALVYAHETLGVFAQDDLRVTTTRQIDAANAQATLATPAGPIVVSLATDVTAPARLTCRGTRLASAREFRGVSIAHAIEEPA